MKQILMGLLVAMCLLLSGCPAGDDKVASSGASSTPTGGSSGGNGGASGGNGGTSGGNGGSSGTTFVPSTTKQTIGPQGAVLMLTDSQTGTIYALDIPAGAVKQDTEFTITTLEPGADQLFRVKLEPEGILFQDGKKAALTVTLPNGVPLPNDATFAYNGFPIPFTVNPDNTLSVQLAMFLTDETQQARWGMGRMLAKIGDFLVPTAAAAGPDCNALDAAHRGGVSLGQGYTVDDYVKCVNKALTDVEFIASYAEYPRTVLIASNAIEQAKQVIDAVGADPALLEGARVKACHNLDVKASLASQEEADTKNNENLETRAPKVVHELIVPMMMWAELADRLERGTPCQPTSVLKAHGVWGEIIGRAAQLGQCMLEHGRGNPQCTSNYVPGSSTPKQASVKKSATASDFQDEYSSGTVALRQFKHELAAVDAAEWYEPIDSPLMPVLVKLLIEEPWEHCQNDQDYRSLIELAEKIPDEPQILKAAQYCGATLKVELRDAPTEAVPAPEPLDAKTLGGTEPGKQTTSENLGVKKGQRLKLEGPIHALGCPGGSDSDETLVVKFNGEVVDTRSEPPFYDNALTYQVNSLLAAANLSGLDEEDLTSYPLTVTRTGDACGGFWGENPQPLLTLHLNFSNVCKPAEGFNFCITPVLDSSGNPVSGLPVGLNTKGSVLFAGGRLWRAGQISTIAGETHESGTALNDHDQVAFTDTSGFPYKAAVWSNGLASYLPASGFAIATGINNDGTVAGYVYLTRRHTNCESGGTGEGLSYVAVSWNDTGTLSRLNGYDVEAASHAFAINASGQAAGVQYRVPPGCAQIQEAMSWSDNSGSGGTVQASAIRSGYAATVYSAHSIDDQGTVMLAEYPQDLSSPARLHVGSVTNALGLGPAGHTYDRDTHRIVNIHTGVVAELGSNAIPGSLGWDLNALTQAQASVGGLFSAYGVPVPYGLAFDRLGRMAGVAPRNSVNTPFILTPKDVELPPTAPAAAP